MVLTWVIFAILCRTLMPRDRGLSTMFYFWAAAIVIMVGGTVALYHV